jgi:hypothetical protein
VVSRRRTGRRLWRGGTAVFGNLELEGGRHVPSLLSRGVGCSGTVMGGLGSSLEGDQSIDGESKRLHQCGNTHGSRLQGCGEQR